MAAIPIDVPSRRRIARACDQCRRRKMRCDGESTCKTCLETGLECSYGRKIRQARGTTYVVHLEKKLKDLEGQLRRLSATSAPSDEEGIQVTDPVSIPNSPSPAEVRDDSTLSTASSQEKSGQAMELISQNRALDGIVDTINSERQEEPFVFNENATGYRGRSTGIEIFRSLRRLCDSFVDSTANLGDSATTMANALDRQFPTHYLSLHSMTNMCLPSEVQLYRWITIAFNEAFHLWPFIDRTSFHVQVLRLLKQPNFGQEHGDIDNLALIHAVIALGQRSDPQLMLDGGDRFEVGQVRGIKHFCIAKDLVGLTECGRSITAVQTVLCMCLYLKSVSAKRMVHTYVSMATDAAYRLGLHATASANHLPPMVQLVHQRVYLTLRMFDAYVTSCLGLPRNIRAIEPTTHSSNMLPESFSESFQAANANIELLDVLGSTIEKVYFTNSSSNDGAAISVPFKELFEVDKKLENWERKYAALTQGIESKLGTCTRYQLLLNYSKCFVVMMLYCPFLHHIAKPLEGRTPHAYAYGSKGIEAAISAVRTAETLETKGLLNESYALTVDILAMAATALLVVELGAPEDASVAIVRETSRIAKILLESVAKQNCSAAQCLESLMPLYEQTSSVAPTINAPVAEIMRDFSLFTYENSDSPLFNTCSNVSNCDNPDDPFDFSMFVQSPSADPAALPSWSIFNPFSSL